MKRNLRGSRIILTGASSGIGRALAVELASAGAKTVVLARREDRLQKLAEEVQTAGGEIVTVVGDVTDPAVRQKTFDEAVSRFGGLDILINNAGVGAMGYFEKADPNRLRRIFEVNVFSLIEMTRLGLPLLKQGNRPMIVNVGSILGHRGVPHSSEYSASKFAVQGFSEAIRAELNKYKIDVLVVSPGTTDTEFFDSKLEKTDDPPWPKHRATTPERVAQETVRAMRRGKHEIIPYALGKIMCGISRLSPRLMDAIMARYA